MDKSLGILLRHHRIAAGLTQEALAERAGLSGQAVGSLERGDRRFPHRDTVSRLAEALGLTDHQRAELAAAAARRRLPKAAASVPQGNRSLPGNVADFTGRTEEIETCARWVAGDSGHAPVIIVVDGMAGSGKSTFALHLAHRFADRHPDGQLFLDLHGYTPDQEPVVPDAAVGHLLRLLGTPGSAVPTELDHSSALWRSELARRRTLIVLDNVRDVEQVRPLLPGSPGHLVLITSRHRLAELDCAHHLTLEPMPEPDAVDLFVWTAQRTVADRQVVAEVVALCGHLPLAIRLAATRLRHRRPWTVGCLADRLRDEQRRLAELVVGGRNVAGAFALSYRHLPARERRVYRLLGLHPGADIDVRAAAALCGLAVEDARRVLEHLADMHLLRERSVDRYTFHDLLRMHARSTAHEDEPEAARRAALTRLLAYYEQAVATGNQAADASRHHCLVEASAFHLPSFADPHDAWEWCETERANLLATVQAAAQAGMDVPAWRLAQALVPFQSQMGYAQDRHDSQLVALRCARRVGNQTAEASILVDLAAACHRLGRGGQARAHYENAMRLARDIGNALVEGRAVARLGIVHQSEGDYRQAEILMCAALRLFRSIGDRREEGVTLAVLAILREHAGRYAESLRTFGEALAIMEEVGPLVHKGRAYNGLGALYAKLGRYAEAEEQLQRALRHARTVRDRVGEVEALFVLGVAQADGGKPANALDCFLRVLEAGRDMHLGAMEAQVLTRLGAVRSQLGDNNEALELQQKALSLATMLGAHDLCATIHNDLADSHAVSARYAESIAHYRRALALARKVGLPDEQARAHRGLAEAET